MAGEVFLGLLRPRGVNLGGEAVVDDGPAIEEESDAFLVSAAVVDPVGVNDPPLRAEIAKDAAEIGEVVAQFDDGDQVELAQNLGDVMNGRFGAADVAEFADVPDGNVDRLVELRGRDLGGLDPLAQDEESRPLSRE